MNSETIPKDPLLVLLGVVTAGLLLGRVKLKGLSLGTSGVIFTALAAGHLGLSIPEGVGSLGLVFFVYCVGIGAGPSFFRVFARHGKRLAALACFVVAVGGLTTVCLARLLGISPDLAAGLFSGSMTSTPGLAAALDVLPEEPGVAVGYGLAYPLGVVAVVLFAQLLPRLTGVDLQQAAREADREDAAGQRIERIMVEVRNPGVFGKRLEDLELLESNIQVSRVLEGNRMVPVPPGLVLEEGTVLLLVGQAFRLERVVPTLGQAHLKSGYYMEVDGVRRSVVASSDEVVGHSLKELRSLGRFGVTVVRIRRHDIEFVPTKDEGIHFGDSLVVVGTPEGLDEFASFAGHSERNFDVTDLMGLGAGMAIGVLLGKVELSLGGASFRLGSAGGPLFVSLLLGHFGGIGPIAGSLPRASRFLLMELGLVFFLAQAGVSAGGAMVGQLAESGPQLGLAAALVAVIPMLAGFLAARYLFRMDLSRSLGGICGAMTSTPGLGAVTDQTDSEGPVVAYAAAYPVALVLMTMIMPLVVAALR